MIQTDTTVGFVSQDSQALIDAKERDANKTFIQVSARFENIKKRVPKAHRKFVRRSVKTTFVYSKTYALRIVKWGEHANFLKHYSVLYSTSANKSGCVFEKSYAIKNADIICEDKRGFSEKTPSRIYKLYKYKKVRLR